MQSPFRDLVPIPAVWQRLERVEARLFEVTKSENPFVTEIAQHLLGAGGKRYRPLLAQVAGELGADTDGPVEAGVAVELVHVGSLYHDDVLDSAATRRTLMSVNARWSTELAILGGDFLLAKASEVAAPLGTEAVVLLARTYASLVEGQILEDQLAGRIDQTAVSYFQIVDGKTASLIQCSARLGALAADASRDDIEALTAWAAEVGRVFQLTDDVLDFVATDEELGKPAGTDAVEGKFTLPVIAALESVDGERLRSILSLPADERGSNRAEIIDIVKRSGGVQEALAAARGALDRAHHALANVAEDRVASVLRGLGRFLIDRAESIPATASQDASAPPERSPTRADS